MAGPGKITPKTQILLIPSMDNSGGISDGTKLGGITLNPSSPTAIPIITPTGTGSVLELLDWEKKTMPIVTTRGLSGQSLVDVVAYVDPASLLLDILNPQRENYTLSQAPFQITTDANGLITNIPGADSVSLRNISCFGYLVSAKAVNTMSAQTKLDLNVVSNTGAVISNFSFYLEDVNRDGWAFIARTGRGINVSVTESSAAVAPFGAAFPNDSQISISEAQTTLSNVQRLIFQDSDVAAGVQNYNVIQAANLNLQIIPVLINPYTKFAFYEHLFADKLADFGDWVINNYLKLKTVSAK